MKKYFKTDNADTVRALKEHRDRIDALYAAGDEFAARFNGATPMYETSISGVCFAGLRFETPQPVRIWRKPGDHRIQHLRAKPDLKGLQGEERDRVKAEHAALKSLFSEHEPKARVTYDDFFSSIGTDWGNVAFHGISYFMHQGLVYVATSVSLADHLTEITGSEFESRREEKKEKEKDCA